MKTALTLILLIVLPSLVFSFESFKVVYEQESHVPLSNPHDIKLSPDGRYLMVSDVGNNRVAILDPESLSFLGAFGQDHQSGTHDIDFDQAGFAYVADTHNNRVTIYKLENMRASLIGELSGSFRGPEGVLAHPNGQVYVAGAWSGNVVAFNQNNLSGELSNLSSPHDLELAKDGRIWVADSGNDRILLVSQNLEIESELSREQYGFRGVRYLDLLDDGTLIAADKYTHSVKFIGPDGALRYRIGDGKPSRGKYQLTTPEGVEVQGNWVWISDSGNDRIIRYRIE